MTNMGKLIMFAGVALLVAGAVVYLLGRTGFRGLPGDIVYQTNGTRIYFPIVTMLALSAVATFLLWLWTWLSSR